MRLLFILLVSLACADALAQARHRPDPRDDGGEFYRTDEDWHERRRGLRAFREEIRQQEEAAAAQRQVQGRSRQFDVPPVRQDRPVVTPAPSAPEPQQYADRRRLRRLSPEDRQRMREEMREVFRH